MDKFEYIGWVPCVNGHLDFGLTRVGIKGGFTDLTYKDNSIIEENFSCTKQLDSHERRILLQSKVNWRDTEKFDKDKGHFRVTVTAETSPSQSMDKRSLTGNILIYPLGAEPKSRDKRRQMNIFNLSHAIKKNQDRLLNFNQLNKIVAGEESIDNFDDDYFSCSISFEIQANGITKLKYNNKNFGSDNETRFLIARQAFYYLKYAIHTHKHHTTKEDSLTTITPIYDATNTDLNDAGLRLICQLKRELTALKRTQSIDKKTHPTSDVAGIIAYVKSLIFSLEQSEIISPSIKLRELERFECILASFTAQTDKIRTAFSDLEMIKSKSKVWLGFVIVSSWGFLNFMFKSNTDNKIILPLEYSYLILIPAIIICVSTYNAVKYYYKKGLDPEANEALYHEEFKTLNIKTAIPIIISAFLMYIYSIL